MLTFPAASGPLRNVEEDDDGAQGGALDRNGGGWVGCSLRKDLASPRKGKCLQAMHRYMGSPQQSLDENS
jgi:hypothetical protein